MKRFDRYDVGSLAVIAAGVLASALVFDRLPARMATHFDAHGIANGWSSRAFGAFFSPAIALGVWALLRGGEVLMPEAWRARLRATPTSAVAFVVVSGLTAVHVVVLRAALDPAAAPARGLAVALGAMWIALGLVLPRVRRNPLVGVRTVWTLTSDENWARTHRVAGYAFALGGIAAVGAGIVGGTAAMPFALSVVVAAALFPAVYSYVLARSLPPSS